MCICMNFVNNYIMRGELIMFYDKLDEICTKNHISVTKLLKTLNMSKGNLTNWKNGASPNFEIVCKISDYFSVPLDYFADRENSLTDSEGEFKIMLKGSGKTATLYRIIEKLNKDGILLLTGYAKGLLESEEYTISDSEEEATASSMSA